jgi:hypothetical protein
MSGSAGPALGKVIESAERLNVPEEVKEKIFSKNTKKPSHWS